MALKRLPIVAQDQGNWGQLLNDNIKQIADPNKGGFNIWTADTRPANLTADDEGKSGVNKNTGKIERWNGQAWEVLGEQIVVPYETATGTYRAYYSDNTTLKIEGVGTQFLKLNVGDVIRQFDGTNLGTEIEIIKIIDDTNAFGSFDDFRNRVKDTQPLGLSNIASGGIYTVNSTVGLAIGDLINFEGVYYGDIIYEIIDGTRFRGNPGSVNAGNGTNLVAFKLPRAGSQYKISKSSFTVTDPVSKVTKFAVSNFRTTVENLDASNIQSKAETLFENINPKRGGNNYESYVKNNFPSVVQSWYIHNNFAGTRGTVLSKYPTSTNDVGVIYRTTAMLLRNGQINYSTTPVNPLTRIIDSLAVEVTSIGKCGVIENAIGISVAASLDGNSRVYKRTGLQIGSNLPSYFSGNVGIGTPDAAAGLQISSRDLLINGGYGVLMTNNFNNGGTGFVYGAGWAYQDYTDTLGQWSEKWARHTPGNTASLTYPLTLDNSKFYVIFITVKNTNAGSVKFSMGGSAPQDLVNNFQNIIKMQSSTSAAFEIIPTSDFDGAIDDVSVFSVNPDEGRQYIFGRIGVNTLNPAASIDVKGNIIASGTITPSSDERLKTNITPLTQVIDKLVNLNGVTYNWLDPANHGDDTTTQIGLIAQDVEKVFPEAVKTNSETGYKSLNYNGLVGVLVEAVKEQQDAIKEQKTLIYNLEKQATESKDLISNLEKRLSALENK
jgi:hypothetical protein